MNGILDYKTKSGFRVVKVHYSADPEKDPKTDEGQEWLRRSLEGVMGGVTSSAWRREMEIDFSAKGGTKIFPELEAMHESILVDPFVVPDWWKIEGGYDFGRRNPFSYHDYAIDGDRGIFVVYEAYGSDFEIPAQVRLIKASPFFSRVGIRHADPSIWAEDEHNERRDGYTSKQQIFSELGIHFAKGRQDDIAGIERLEKMLFDVEIYEGGVRRVPKKAPQIKIFKTCMNLWNELINLRWSEHSVKVEEERGKKEELKQTDNHAWDDLKYFLLSLPDESVKPKPRSTDQSMPLAGELLDIYDKEHREDRR